MSKSTAGRKAPATEPGQRDATRPCNYDGLATDTAGNVYLVSEAAERRW